MAPRRTVRVNNFDYKKLTANDVVCPVCRTILIKPITLPCHHGFCLSCFEITSNAVCPLCRVRVGSWLRSATKSKKVINESFWKAIQDSFPSQVRSKLSNLDENFIPDEDSNITLNRHRRILHRKIDNFVKATSPTNNNRTRNNRRKSPAKSADTSPINKTRKKVAQNEIKKESLKLDTKPPSIDLTTKEFTCRILRQDGKAKANESQQNKKIKSNQAEAANERSNSIEPEYLYFKPINHKQNPTCVTRPPVKVPTEKPSINHNAKIVPPSGQIVTLNSLVSAFARLMSVVSPEQSTIEVEKVKNVKKRVNARDNKPRKKAKVGDKAELIIASDSSGETSPFRDFEGKSTNKSYNQKDVDLKRIMQEKADLELARKLHAELNSYKYSTRSSAFKRSSSKR